MVMVQIRDVPDEVHAQLRAQAEREGMSLNRYLLRELRKIARQGHNAEVLRRARERPGKRLSRESIVAEIRAMRGE